MVPNIFHFVFGMAEDYGGMPFSLPHYLAIKSAADINRPEKIYFHYEFEPSGEWWDKARPLLTLNKIKAPCQFMGRHICHVAHKADVVRLLALKEYGGVYLDTDTICLKPLHSLFDHSFIMGEELKTEFVAKNRRQRIKHKIRTFFKGENSNKITGLCNAILLAEKDSFFVNKWLETYKNFRSEGRDKYWNEHSVKMPLRLSKKYPDKITRLSPYAFFYPLYDHEGVHKLFEEVAFFPGAYLYHLWESFTWNTYLNKLTVEDIFFKDTTYNLLARKFLTEIKKTGKDESRLCRKIEPVG